MRVGYPAARWLWCRRSWRAALGCLLGCPALLRISSSSTGCTARTFPQVGQARCTQTPFSPAQRTCVKALRSWLEVSLALNLAARSLSCSRPCCCSRALISLSATGDATPPPAAAGAPAVAAAGRAAAADGPAAAAAATGAAGAAAAAAAPVRCRLACWSAAAAPPAAAGRPAAAPPAAAAAAAMPGGGGVRALRFFEAASWDKGLVQKPGTGVGWAEGGGRRCRDDGSSLLLRPWSE